MNNFHKRGSPECERRYSEAERTGKLAPESEVGLCDAVLVNGRDNGALWRMLNRQRIAKQAHKSMESLTERKR